MTKIYKIKKTPDLDCPFYIPDLKDWLEGRSGFVGAADLVWLRY